MNDCGNPFIDGTWAHIAYESIHGTCKKKPTEKRNHGRGMGIPIDDNLKRAIRKQFGIEVYKSDGTLA